MMAVIRRDMAAHLAGGGGAATGLVFFLAVIATIPFGLGPDLALLSRVGPAILWIGALLATLLALDRLFQADREDGSLDLLIAGPMPLALTVAAKCAALWLACVLPLVLASPLLGLFLALAPGSILAVFVSLLVGTPALVLVGAVGASVAVALPRGGLLVSVLVLPLAMPVLIFGVGVAQAAAAGAAFGPPLMLLAALTLFFAVIGPWASAAALRASAD
ncbi:heme exporter protein CcmB [Aureimonas populi]|uniref:Heme exporter protein B n=1 Tax=Aureimonas populi TaxID=1701758 RepID=A0ABW5CRR0_9HYPH|nr:heme exporter protein CcmB [Aureimonas populi]